MGRVWKLFNLLGLLHFSAKLNRTDFRATIWYSNIMIVWIGGAQIRLRPGPPILIKRARKCRSLGLRCFRSICKAGEFGSTLRLQEPLEKCICLVFHLDPVRKYDHVPLPWYKKQIDLT